MPRQSATLRSLLAPLLGLPLVVSLMGATPAGAVRLSESPPRKVLIVTANLDEAEGAYDMHHTGDLKAFVTKLVDKVPFEPDALLLQEVEQKGANFVADEMRRQTGANYRSVKDAGRSPWRKTKSGVVATDTAIVLNMDSMKVLSSGGFISTRFSKQEAARGKPALTKRHAFLMAGERDGGLEVPMVSLHLATDFNMRSYRIAKRKRTEWAKKIVSTMRNKYPNKFDRARAIGGDWNAGRCSKKGHGCRVLAFWRYMNKSGHRDSHFTIDTTLGVDMIFTNKSVVNARIDPAKNRNPYSDHVFRWAVIGGDDPTAPAPVQAHTETWDKAVVRIDWTQSSEDWSFMAGYELWKSRGGKYQKILFTQKMPRIDDNVRRGEDYFYKVRAVNGAGMKGPFSNPVRAVPGHR